MKPFDAELQKKLTEISSSKKVNIITFIAPDAPVRVSPVHFSSAQIRTEEMYELEKQVRMCEEEKGYKKLHLVIHTPGGDLTTSFKIAQYLRSKYEDIHVFIPYEASSGGTLICCAANRISMGDLANITPTDPQVPYKGGWVSAYSIVRAADGIRDTFPDKMPQELPSPWQQMADKMDPVLYDEMSTAVWGTALYAGQLLKASGYTPEAELRLAVALTRTNYPHSHCFMRDEAKGMGFNIVAEKEFDGIMDVYRQVVTHCLQEAGDKHVIKHWCSSPPVQTQQTPTATATPATPDQQPLVSQLPSSPLSNGVSRPPATRKARETVVQG